MSFKDEAENVRKAGRSAKQRASLLTKVQNNKVFLHFSEDEILSNT
jgi:hypothetical protein